MLTLKNTTAQSIKLDLKLLGNWLLLPFTYPVRVLLYSSILYGHEQLPIQIKRIYTPAEHIMNVYRIY